MNDLSYGANHGSLGVRRIAVKIFKVAQSRSFGSQDMKSFLDDPAVWLESLIVELVDGVRWCDG